MAIDTSGQFWRGEDTNDLAEYLREFQAGGYPVARVNELACTQCASKTFRNEADDDAGCARARCLACGTVTHIADSAEFADEADLAECACPCGGETFNVGFALREDGDVRWISVGLRCVQDGTLGAYADWKIDYSPTSHLLSGPVRSRGSRPAGPAPARPPGSGRGPGAATTAATGHRSPRRRVHMGSAAAATAAGRSPGSGWHRTPPSLRQFQKSPATA